MPAKLVTIESDCCDQRIDNYLITMLKGVPKTRIYRALRKGEVRVNGKRIKPEYRLQLQDEVRIPPLRQGQPTIPHAPPAKIRQDLAERILYEDKQLLIINKPAGLAVHGGTGIHTGLIEALRWMRADTRYMELVHRLDRATSGCLVIAKKKQTLVQLHKLLLQRRVHKQYLAIVAGRWPETTTRIESPLLKNQLHGGERWVCVHESGKQAITRFKVLKVYSRATLVQAIPVTGRTHQIRVHAASIGHPIAGDERYGDEKFNKYCKQRGLKRLFYILQVCNLLCRMISALRYVLV